MQHDEEIDQFYAEGGYGASEAPVTEPATDLPSKKRKNGQDSEAAKKPKVQENRAIYVTNLPKDTNETEIEQVFSRFGIIDQGADGNKRIKMYNDGQGKFNGEALIVYFKKDSIRLAVQMLDDYWFRLEEQNHGTIRVKEADFSYKRNKDSDQIVSKMTRKDKKASEKHRADLNRKLAEWSDNEEEVREAYAPKKNKWARIALLKYAFTLEELDEDVEAVMDIKEEIREEAEEYGEVKGVTLYDKEENGIVAIRFADFEGPERFRKAANGRFFGGRKLEVTIAEDRPKFKKTAAGGENDSDDEQRLELIARG